MTRTKEISNCCNAPVRAEWSDDFCHESKLKKPPRGVTVWHVCSACSQICSTHPNVMDIGGKKCKPMSTFCPTKDFAGGWAEEQNDWRKTFRSFYNDNEEGGSSRWRVSPDVVQAFVKELLSQESTRAMREYRDIIRKKEYSNKDIRTLTEVQKDLNS